MEISNSNQVAPKLKIYNKINKEDKFSIGGILTDDQIKDLDNLKNDPENNALLKNQEMGKDQFMKILLTQITHQNPLEPLQDKDFIAQMAQFSALEQSTKSNAELEKLNNEFKDLKNNLNLDFIKDLKPTLDKIQNTLDDLNTNRLVEIKDALNKLKVGTVYE